MNRKSFSILGATLLAMVFLGGNVVFSDETAETAKPADAKRYSLVSKRTAGAVDTVQRNIDVQGKLVFEVDVNTGQSLARVTPDGRETLSPTELDTSAAVKKETREVPIQVTGVQRYEEMLVAAGNLQQGEGAMPTLGAWAFLSDEMKITVDGQQQTSKLNLGKPIFAVDIHDARVAYFRPGDLLTREEKDLLDQQGNTLLLDFLLPGRDVKLGESWQQQADIMGMLLQLDMVFQLKVTTKLTEVKGGTAVLDTEGWVEGSSDGTASKMEIKGKTYFHLASGRITWNGLIIRETRSAGHIAPGMEVTARLQYTIKPVTESSRLTESVISGITFDASQSEFLRCEDPGGVWQCEMDARWFAMSYNQRLATFRMVDKGVLIAQATILTSARESSPVDITMDAFMQEIRQSVRGTIDEVVDSTKTEAEDGTRIYRVEINGQVEDLPLKWIYYQIYTPGTPDRSVRAKQVTMVFTVEDKLQEEYRQADEHIIQTFMWEP